MRREGEGFESLQPFDDPARASAERPRGARFESAYGRPRPRRLPELLDLGFEVLRDRFAVLAGISALMWAPARLAQVFIGPHVWLERPGDFQGLGLGAGTVFGWLSQGLVDGLATAFVSLLVAARLGETRVGAVEALSVSARRLPQLVLLALIYGVMTGLGCLCLIVPGVFLMWRFFVAPTVCVLERASIGQSLGRSYDLAVGSFGVWAGVYLLLALLTSSFTSVAVIGDNVQFRPYLMEGLGLGRTAFDALVFCVSTLFLGVSTSIKAVLATVFYFHCLARRDGLDLERELERLQEASR